MKNFSNIVTEKLKINNYTDKSNNYFYHEALDNGYTTFFSDTDNILECSYDNCKTWVKLDADVNTNPINKGERIYFKGKNMKFDLYDGIGCFRSNSPFNVGGNIMTLIYGDDFKYKTELLSKYQFRGLFFENTQLVSAEELLLPAEELTEECYAHMFSLCSKLKKAPELPAVKLAIGCYEQMFTNCDSLVETPELLADKLEYKCYHSMFSGCNGLKYINTISYLSYNCGMHTMFEKCDYTLLHNTTIKIRLSDL